MISATILLAASIVAQPPARSQATTEGLRFEDQFERRRDPTELRGGVAILLYGDRRGQDANKALGEWLFVRFHPQAAGLPADKARSAPVIELAGLPAGAVSAEVHVVPVACVGPVPNVVKSVLRGQIKKASPDVAVWMDFGHQMRDRFGLTPAVANLVVLDVWGRPRFKAAGTFGEQELAKVADVVERLRLEAAGR